ncbi:hypothetical protein [Arthrobacter woluwensis]|uniref:Uncharacterized protein n=1 Tax=Arthrobacter woluwensis TaxID=156980 RepID=A0A1H4WAA9_9MICC|nr:hypothetical protein [Arthrobacter woluwensis]SEC89688.1 hypothetical protein SAMN04489745_3452 [Arthrobacter woluwensis]SEC95911.1 hypothetical protein SAMN04489745_3552 [Arthrobacter woluwensis]
MSEQYIVAVLPDLSLVVDACGPFRSRQRAGAAAKKINDAGAWTEADPDGATIIAQVVRLRSVEELVEEARDHG